jgi:hypothetical protein
MMTYFVEDRKVESHFENIFSILKYFQSSIVSYTDPRIEYLLGAWNRILAKLGEKGKPYISDVLNIISKVLEQLAHFKKFVDEKKSQSNLLDSDDNRSEADYLQDFELSNTQIIIAIKILIIIYNQVSSNIGSQAQPLLENVIIGLTLVRDNEIKKVCGKAVETIMKNLVKNESSEKGHNELTGGPHTPIQMLKIIITLLFGVLETEKDPKLRSFLIKAIKELTEVPRSLKIFISAELPAFFKSLLLLLSKSFNAIIDADQKLTNEDLTETHEVNYITEIIETEAINLNLIGSVYHTIFVEYQESCFY